MATNYLLCNQAPGDYKEHANRRGVILLEPNWVISETGGQILRLSLTFVLGNRVTCQARTVTG
jgi:hypothetical protein